MLGQLAVSQVAQAQQDAVIGTWKLNVAKSKYDPGPAPKGSTLTLEVAGDGIKVTAKGQNAEGKPTGTQYTAKYDGKDYPITLTGSQDYDSVALKRIDAFKAEGTRKKAGKVVQTYTRVVSPDGKVLTITSKGTNSKPYVPTSVRQATPLSLVCRAGRRRALDQADDTGVSGDDRGGHGA